jgi:hypothetical protein
MSAFHVPAGEHISAARFQAYIGNNNIAGLGIAGITPASVACQGHAGNGVADLSDFQAGNANPLGHVDSSAVQYSDVLTFDATAFITTLVSGGQRRRRRCCSCCSRGCRGGVETA